MPAGSTVRVLDLGIGQFVAGTVVSHQNGDLMVDTGDGQPIPVPPAAAVPVQIAPMPPEPRAPQTIMQQDGVLAPQAVRRAQAERDAYQAATGIALPPTTRGDLAAILADPRSNEEIRQEMENGGEPVPSAPPPTVGTGQVAAPVVVQRPGDLEVAAGQVAQPTPAQAEAGNYKMGHLNVGGLQATIETPMGAERTGTGENGQTWSVHMPADYGYIKGTTGADGDHIDAYFGPDTHRAQHLPVYVIDQINPRDGSFDEHKAMIGFPTEEAARHAYQAAFSDGSAQSRLGAMNPMSWRQFRTWAKTGGTQGPISYKPPPTLAERAKQQATVDELAHRVARQAVVRTLAAVPEYHFTDAEIHEAALETLGGLTATEAILKVAHRAALEAVAQSGGDLSNVEQPGQQQQSGQGGAEDGGVRRGRPAATEPAAHGEQPAGSHGSVPSSAAWDQIGERAPGSEQAGTRGVTPGKGQPSGDGGAASQVDPAREYAAALDAQSETAGGREAGVNYLALAQVFRGAFGRGDAFPTITAARQFAAGITSVAIKPGTIEAKAIDEAIELGVVLRARDILAAGGNRSTNFDALLHLYQVQQPRLGVRTSDSMDRQAYSTPVPLAYAASVLAGITPQSLVYEPTAGNGALLIDVSDPTLAVANEIDPERVVALRAQGFDPLSTDAAVPMETLARRAFDVVIANPPFGPVRADGKTVRFDVGAIQPGYSTSEIDHAISLFSLDAMVDDGTAVLILGGVNKQVKGPKARADAYRGKAKNEFFFTLYGKYNVVDHFTVPGELYEKQGAGWPVDVIVIRGRGKSALPLPAVAAPRIVETWAGIKEIVNGAPGVADTGLAAGRPAPAGVGQPGEPAGEQRPADTGAGGQAADVGAVSAGAGEQGGVDAGAGGRPGERGGSAGGNAGQPGSVGRPAAVPEQPASGAGDAGGQPSVPGPAASEQPAAGKPSESDAGGGARSAGDDDLGLAGPSVQRPGGRPLPRVEDEEPQAIVRATVDTGKAQAPYVPSSKATPVGTLVPTNLSDAISNALEGVLARVSNEMPDATVDKFVADRLRYTAKELQEYFSAEQVDAIALAIKQVDAGSGFIIGDQTGVGKGRVVAAMIRYAELQGLVPVFVTEKPSLYADMVRDLTAIGMADMADAILATNNDLKLQLTEDPRGPRLRTGQPAEHTEVLRKAANAAASTGKLPPEFRVVMTTYSQMQTVKGARTTRQSMLTSLAPRAFVIMDESHNAGGAAGMKEEKVDKKGKLILPRSVLFRQVIQAASSVFYSSATWAKRPDVMDLYGAKTSMRFAVKDLKNLADAISAGGVPMQQIVTAGLADGGQYIRRERSFEGVTYDLVPIEVDHKAYDNISLILKGIYDVSGQVAGVVDEIDDELKGGAAGASGSHATGDAGATSTSFGSVMHNLIAQMLLASKTKGAIDRALEKLKEGKKPVLTLANTMGSFIGEFTADNGAKPGDELALNFNNLLKRYLKKTLVYSVKKPFGEVTERGEIDPKDLPDGGALYRAMEKAIDAIDLSNLPVSPIDYIKAKLEAKGYSVGEITGRQEAAEYRSDGSVRYRRRPGKELTANAKNATIRAFNGGELDVLVINQSGASGVSLHASETFRDKRKRSMLIMQAENNIDTHMQMLGRVHRTGQVIPPEYEQLVADIPAEKRPAAVLAAKMASLNASTTSSRQSVMGDENAPDFLNQYGDEIVDRMLEDDYQLAADLMNPKGDSDEEGDAKAKPNIAKKVTGRIPLLRLARQTEVYDEIEKRYKSYIAELDAAGENALEAKRLDLDARQIQTHTFLEGNAEGSGPFAAPANLTQFDIKRLFKPPSPGQIVGSLLRANGLDVQPPADATPEQLATTVQQALRGSTQHADLVKDIQDTFKRESARTFKKEGAAEAHKAKMTEARGRILAFLEVARPGAVITIKNSEAENAEEVPCLVEAIHIDDKLGDLAPSRYSVSVVTAEGLRRLIDGPDLYVQVAPAKEGEEEGKAPKVGARIIAKSKISVAALLEGIAENGRQLREDRWFLTGNLLAAFATVGKGQIVNFTDNEGRLQQGMMMPKGYAADRILARSGQALRGALAARFLDQTYPDAPPFITTSDGVVRLAKNTHGDFVLTVPASRSKGGRYFLDRDLRNATGPLVAAGQNMRVRFRSAVLPSVLRALNSINEKAEVHWTSNHPEAKAFAASQGGPSPGGGPTGGARRPEARFSLGRTAFNVSSPTQTIQPRALSLLASTIYDMTGNRVEIEVLRKGTTREDGELVFGRSIGGSLIQVALMTEPETTWVLHHEAVHSLRTFGLIRPGEWKALEARSDAENWQDRYHVPTGYAQFSPEVRSEEVIAHGFSDYMRHRRTPPAGMIGVAVNRVTTFFKRTASALRGDGFTRAEDVFERIATGEVGKREDQPSGRTVATPDEARAAFPEAADTLEDTLKALTTAGIVDPSNAATAEKALNASVRYALGPLPPAATAAPATTVAAATGATAALTTHLLDFKAMVGAAAKATNLWADPMTAGSDDSMVIAKRAANAARAIRYAGKQEITRLGKEYTQEQLKRMWQVLDTQSVEIQMGQPTTGFGAKSAFPTLSTEERAEADVGQREALMAWQEAKALGMVHGEPLPSYVPRMVILEDYLDPRRDQTKKTRVVQDYRTLVLATMHLREAIVWRIMIEQIKAVGQKTGAKTVHAGGMAANGRPPRGGPGNPMDKLTGVFTTTAQMRKRKNLTVEETLEGAEKVAQGKEAPWFTIPNNRAFWTLQWSHNDENGEPKFVRVPIYIRPDFEGPLRAILHGYNSGAGGSIYRGLMNLKGRMMTAIMWGVKHLGVVGFRAFTVARNADAAPNAPRPMPKLVKLIIEGHAAQHEANTMRRLIQGGLVPMGRNGVFQDIEGLEKDIEDKPGRSWTSQVMAWPISFINETAANAVKRGFDVTGDFVHQRLMWDQIAAMQVGITLGVERHLIRGGMDPRDALIIATREGNLAAGAIPREAMAHWLSNTLNLVWFSKSYRSTTTASVKDIFGLPRDLQALIKENNPGQVGIPGFVNRAVRQLAQVRVARSIAWKVLRLEMGLYFIAGSLLQSGLTVYQGHHTASEELQGYYDRLIKVGSEIAHGERVNPFTAIADLTPMAEHEAGKEARILIGHEPDKTAIYMRLGVGKIAEDIMAYATDPYTVLHNIESPLFRWVDGSWHNDAGLNRKIVNPYAHTIMDHLGQAWDWATWSASLAMPMTEIGSISRLAGGTGGGYQAAQIIGSGLGFSLSRGYPGGEQAGATHQVKTEHDYNRLQAFRQVIELERAGKTGEAQQVMTKVGILPKEQVKILAHIKQPGATPRTINKMLPFATPAQRTQMLRTP